MFLRNFPSFFLSFLSYNLKFEIQSLTQRNYFHRENIPFSCVLISTTLRSVFLKQQFNPFSPKAQKPLQPLQSKNPLARLSNATPRFSRQGLSSVLSIKLFFFNLSSSSEKSCISVDIGKAFTHT